jgi:oligopeptide transport system ATP-binding protein
MSGGRMTDPVTSGAGARATDSSPAGAAVINDHVEVPAQASTGRDDVAPLLAVRDLKTHFFTADGVLRAVDGVSFDVRAGEALGIVGESGCGKSVTALSILRLVPDPPGKIVGGEILFEGRDILQCTEAEMRSLRGDHIAMIFQDPMTSLNPVLPIGRQVGEALRLHKGLGADAARKRAVELLEMVGIPSPDSRLSDYPHQFSGGMRQRAMIAMALACEPQVVIADEPTTALDVTVQAQIIDLVKELRTTLNTAIIWITHDLGVVAGLCNNMVVMYAGHVVEEAPVAELYANPSHPYTFGLLQSLPRLDDDDRTRLVPIEGLPPDLTELTEACDFWPRCAHAQEICQTRRPALRSVAPSHAIACWLEVEEWR